MRTEMLIAGMTCYQFFGYFLVYSFIGWVVEVAYHAVTQGKVVNRGFLAGPVCPVYGFGALLVFGVIDLAAGVEVGEMGQANAGLIFLCGMVLASAVEFLGGWGLYHAFHARWWDYRDKPFNLGGYICLEFSIYWGIGALMIVRILHPVLDRFIVGLVPERWGWPLMVFLYAVYCADSVVTILIVMGLNKHLAELDALRASMRIVSNELSERIGEGTLDSMQRIDESRVQAALTRAELRDAVEERRAGTEREIARRKAEADLRRQAREEENARWRKSWEAEADRLRDSFEEDHARRRETWEEETARLRNALEDGRSRRREVMEARTRELRAALEKGRLFGPRRILKAFPRLSYDANALNDLLREMREEINGKPGMHENKYGVPQDTGESGICDKSRFREEVSGQNAGNAESP